jgi:quercetin dioxygenase-like cupin family protein
VEAIVLRPGEGETVTDEPESFVQIKAGLDELAVTESRYSEGESGPGPHIHREHVDAFWVLDGELTFELGAGEVVKAPAETFVLVPPEVVHTFRNEGPGDARFLNIHAPSRDFHRQLRGEDVDFDTEDPPPDGGRPATEAIVRVNAGGGDAGGRLALMDTTLQPGFSGPAPHSRPGTVESFYVLAGVLTVRVNERTEECDRGTYLLMPPGNAYTLSNGGEDPVRLLQLLVPVA